MENVMTAKPYEILIRFDPVSGVLKGAHLQQIDGAAILDPVPLLIEDGAAGGLWDVLDDALHRALADVNHHAGECETHKTRIAELEAELAQQTRTIETARIAQLEAEAIALREENVQAKKEADIATTAHRATMAQLGAAQAALAERGAAA